ncbi:hypothetical protein [Effusibacillus pohliae]|uniref:hypothetical protein n=1 Tax=Effusibacillus pohliae TaxID=232270 RepID=UPI0012EA8C40|nr:hypothetical protein [Effusibacillus pohliae]
MRVGVERRGEAETDPIKQARIAAFLKEYWGVQHGGNRGSSRQNGDLKTTRDIADFIGESKRNTERLLKINDLIPEIQALVSANRLGTTAAEQLAYLTEEEQRTLIDVFGAEAVGRISVEQSKGQNAFENKYPSQKKITLRLTQYPKYFHFHRKKGIANVNTPVHFSIECDVALFPNEFPSQLYTIKTWKRPDV